MANEASVILSLDTKKSIQELKNLNAEMKNNEKEFKKNDEALKEAGKSSEAYGKKIGYLTQQLETQTKITAKIKDTLDNYKTSQKAIYDEITRSTKAYDDYIKAGETDEKTLKRLTSEMEKAQRAYDNNVTAINTYTGKLSDSERAQNKLGAAIKNTYDEYKRQNLEALNKGFEVVEKGALAVTAAYVAAAAAAVKLGLDSIESADNIATQAEKLGLTTTKLQEYNFVGMQTDVTSESIGKAFKSINTTIGEMKLGIENNATKALQKLQSEGKLTVDSLNNTDTSLYAIIGALSQYEDFATRSALASQIFGERTAQDLNPILSQSSADIQKLITDFNKLGYVSEENIKTLTDMDNTLNELKYIISLISTEAGAELMPLFQQFADYVKENKDGIKEFAVGTVKAFADITKAIYDNRGAIAAAVAVYGTLKAALAIASIVNGLTNAQKTLTNATQLATAAQAAYNLALSANPIALVVTAVAALTAGIGAYILVTQGATSETEKYKKEIKDLLDQNNESVKSFEAEYDVVSRLIPQIEELASKANRTAAEQNTLNKYIDEVNELLPGTIDKTKVLAGEYDGLTASIDAAYNAMLNQIKLQAREDDLLALQKERNILEDRKKSLEQSKLSLPETIFERRGIRSNENLIKDVESQLAVVNEEYAKVEAEWKSILEDINKPVTSTGAGGTSSVTTTITAEIKAFKDAQEELEYLHKRGKKTDKQYYNDLEALQKQHLEKKLTGTDEELEQYKELWRQIDVEIYQGRQGKKTSSTSTKTKNQAVLNFEAEKKQLKYLQDMEIITTTEFYDALERASKKYLQNEKDLSQEIEVEIFKGRQAIALSATKDVKSAAEISLEKFKSAADKLEYERKMDLLSEEKYYEEKKKLQQQYLTEDSAEWREVNLDIYNHEKEMRQKQIDDLKSDNERYKSILTDRYNSLKNAIEKEYAEIDRIENQQERNQRLSELAAEQGLYANAVTQAGRDKLKSIQDEIKSLNKESLREAREQEKQMRLDALEQQYNVAMDMQDAAFTSAQDNLNNFTDMVAESFNTIAQAASLAVSAMSANTVGGNKVNITNNATIYDQPSAYAMNAWLLSQITGR